MRGGGEAMDFPPWMQRAIQARLDEVSAQFEQDSELSRVRGENDEAFEALFAGQGCRADI